MLSRHTGSGHRSVQFSPAVAQSVIFTQGSTYICPARQRDHRGCHHGYQPLGLYAWRTHGLPAEAFAAAMHRVGDKRPTTPGTIRLLAARSVDR